MSTTIIPGPNVFTARSGSLFSTAANWSRGLVPTGSDVALIADNCTIDINRVLGSLIVQPGFTASVSGSVNFQINSVINVLGQLSSSGTPNIFSAASKNVINNFQSGVSNFYYNGAVRQSIAAALYNNLYIRNSSGSKVANGNIIVSGTLDMATSSFDLGPYNLIVSGTTTLASGIPRPILLKTKPGNITFIGNVNLLGGNNGLTDAAFDMSGNPDIELRNGFRFNTNGGYFFSGFGRWTFTTNSQQMRIENAAARPREFYGQVIVSGSINLTFDPGAGGESFYPNAFVLRNNINGTEAASTCSLSSGNLLFVGDVTRPMKTGSFNYLVDGTGLGFISNNNFTLPYTNYKGLIVGGSGTATVSGPLTASYLRVGANWIGGAGIFDLQSQNAYISGAVYINAATLQKSGPGSIFISGNVLLNSFNSSQYNFTGHPSVELRGGLTWDNGNLPCYSGTGSWRFTTNNQSISQVNSSGNQTFDCNITIENVAVTYSYNGSFAITLNNVINSSGSGLFLNRGNLYFGTSQSLSGSFLSGTGFDFTSSNTSTVVVGGNYSATIPARFNTFYNLGVTGTGIKTLGTSSYVSGTLTFTNPATFELSSSNLFVSGTTNTGNGIAITRSGSGITVFNGRVTQLDFGKIDFSYSNSNIEFRNGVDSRFQAYVFLGSGSAIFSTNDQSYLGTIVNTGDIIISGSIRLRNQSTFNVYKTINGTSASSILDNSGSIYFMTASAVDNSMLTGSFISASFPGSVLGFAFSGSYKIPFSSFRNLVLNPGGTLTSPESKTLSRDTMIYEGISISRDTLETENNNLTVLGTTYSLGGGIKKSGSGSVLLSGSVDLYDNGAIDFRSASNASLEMRGGIIRGTFASRIDMGTTPVTFSINNQNVVACNTSNQYQNILISGSITVGFGLQAGTFVISGSLNGTDANSRFYLSASSTVIYNSSQQPMQIGILDVSSSSATFTYNSGSQDIRGGIYRNLTMLSGTKTLQGNVSVLGTLNTGSGATLATINLNGFTLTNP